MGLQLVTGGWSDDPCCSIWATRMADAELGHHGGLSALADGTLAAVVRYGMLLSCE